MTKARTMVVVCFLAAFAAGIGAGLLVARQRHGPRHRSFLVRELDLTSEQAEKIRAIWSGVREALGPGRTEARRALETEREEAVRALLTKDQVARYDQVLEAFRRKREQMAEERKRRFDKAAEQTKEVLTEAQRLKYEKLLEGRRKRGRRPGRRGFGRPEDAGVPPPPPPPPSEHPRPKQPQGAAEGRGPHRERR